MNELILYTAEDGRSQFKLSGTGTNSLANAARNGRSL